MEIPRSQLFRTDLFDKKLRLDGPIGPNHNSPFRDVLVYFEPCVVYQIDPFNLLFKTEQKLVLFVIHDLLYPVGREGQPFILLLLDVVDVIELCDHPLSLLFDQLANHPVDPLAADLLIKTDDVLGPIVVESHHFFALVLFIVFRKA